MALKNVNRRDADPDLVAINTIRTLSMDAVQVAHSGHPGTPMALAPLVYTLWQRILRFDPDDPSWKDRDRFVLSAGHASMLLYSILFLCGVKAPRRDGPPGEALAVPLEEIRRFRQIDSLTPGHPESGLTAGVETTTGPLGQGAGVSVGMAIGQRWLAARYNRPGFDLFTHRVWVVCSDGDMMEGVSSEAASLAGHLKLDNLCWIYDRNHISIEGSTDLAFSEDTAARFAAYGWHVVHVTDANDTHAIEQALQESRATTGRPTFIVLDSHIAYGAPHKQDDASAHGEPLGEEEVRLTKRFYGWPEDSKFLVPEGVREHLDQTFAAGTRRTAGSTRIWRPNWSACGAGSFRTDGTGICRFSLPTPREWPRGRHPARS
jgi:transketolase